jgi:predicted RNase H-like nuclease (RuvC/YqgF family)
MASLEQEVAELKKRVASLETRLDNQYEWNENLLRRIGDLERAAKAELKAVSNN